MLEPSETFPKLGDLRQYALDRYKEFSKKYGKKQPTQAELRAKRAPQKRTAGKSKSAKVKPKLIESIEQQVIEAGFKLEPPSKRSLVKLTSNFLGSLPEELPALYAVCNGGHCERLDLRILPATEAAEQARAFRELDWAASMGHFPFLDSPWTDPCCVCTRGPLAGYVLYIPHDGPDDAILARSLSRFFDILAETPAEEQWSLEDAIFQPRDSKHAPFEFSGKRRTAADRRAGKELLRLAEQRSDEQDEARHLTGLALKLLTERDAGDIEPLLGHHDEVIRELVRSRLRSFD